MNEKREKCMKLTALKTDVKLVLVMHLSPIKKKEHFIFPNKFFQLVGWFEQVPSGLPLLVDLDVRLPIALKVLMFPTHNEHNAAYTA